MSTPNFSDPPPTAILIAKRGRTKPAAKSRVSNGPPIPWMKIAIGATIAFQAVIVVTALYYLARGERQPIDDDDLVLARPAIKLPIAKMAPAVADVEDDIRNPVEVVHPIQRWDEPKEFPLRKNEFVECARIGTDIRFMSEPAEAFQRARAEKKMVFMVHLSGNLEDKEFT
jgi:hypothetical protein